MNIKKVLYGMAVILLNSHLMMLGSEITEVNASRPQEISNVIWKSLANLRTQIQTHSKTSWNWCCDHKPITAVAAVTLISLLMYNYCSWFRRLIGVEENDDNLKYYLPFTCEKNSIPAATHKIS